VSGRFSKEYPFANETKGKVYLMLLVSQQIPNFILNEVGHVFDVSEKAM